MKRLFTLTVCILSVSLCFSQLRLGLIGGPSSATVVEKNSLPGWSTSVQPNYSNRNAIHLGILIDVPITNRWSFQPAILYMGKGRKYFQLNDETTAQLTDTVSYRNNFSSNYIDVPLNITRKVPLGKRSKLFVSAGPYLGFFYSGKNTIETKSYLNNEFTKSESNVEVGDAVNKVKTFDFGVNARVGFEIGDVLLSGFISQGVSNFYKADYDGTFKHRVFGASIGFWLNKAAPIVRVPPDKDKDGIPDAEDLCPKIAGTVSTHGCPDKDLDGVADASDKCPDVAGLEKYEGCPIPDSDKDGVNDEQDKCPNVAGVEKYNGCPVPDSDSDGINDESDACPDKAGIPEFNGCPIPDSDGDGLNDKEDKCPTESGTKENNGCPEIKKEIVERVNYAAKNIFFTVNSDKLDPKSFEALDELVTILRGNPSLRLKIEGHTDNIGVPAYNMMLSQKRAEAVLQYMEKQGIEPQRLDAVGYGQDQPVGSNKTAAGRAQNRRVVLKLDQQ